MARNIVENGIGSSFSAIAMLMHKFHSDGECSDTFRKEFCSRFSTSRGLNAA